MAVSAAISAQGTIITLGGVAVGEVTGWSGFGTEADMIEVTNLSSPDDRDEWIKTILRSGEVSFDMNYTGASFAEVEALVKSFSKTAFTLQTRSPDDKLYTCATCDVTSNKMTGTSADKISATTSVRLSGDIVATDVI